MLIFETVLALLLAATVLSMIARKINVPSPALLAVGGAIVAFIPGGPRLQMAPEMILALFVAPILLDSAYDTSLRDLRRNAVPIASLVLIAVGLTTAAVAITARWFFPDLPWPAAIALGAIVSPPDAVAAIAILNLDEAGELGAAAAMAVLIATASALATLAFMGLAWWVARRTQAWRTLSR